MSICVVRRAALCIFLLTGSAAAWQQKPPLTAARFLKLQVEVASKNVQRTPGFLRANQVTSRIQLAFVLDGTSSMSAEFDALKDNLQGIASSLTEKFTGRQQIPLEMAIVVYRDTESPSGAVSIPSTEFTSDLKKFSETFAKLKVESGGETFEERVDDGLYQALSKLEWAPVTEDQPVTRWIVLCGDAPPFPDEADVYENDAERKSRRPYTRAEIIALAQQKKVSIHSVHCSSGFFVPASNGDLTPEQQKRNEPLLAVAREAHPYSASFMRAVSEASGGHYVNMWDEDAIRAAMDPQVKVKVELPPIAREDIDEASVKWFGQPHVKTTRVAVLPHMPFSTMTHDPTVDSQQGDEFQPVMPVQIATETRYALPKLGNGGFDIISPEEIEAAVNKAVQKEQTDADRIANIASQLDADFVIWGTHSDQEGDFELESRLYNGLDGSEIVHARRVVNSESDAGLTRIVGDVTRVLCQNAASQLEARGFESATVSAFGGQTSETQRPARRRIVPVALNARCQRSLLAGLWHHEQALAYLKPEYESPDRSKAARRLLEEAVAYYEEAIEFEPANPLAHLLLAECYYNLTKQNGTSEEQVRFHQLLDRAFELRNNEDYFDLPMRLEIEAHHALLSADPDIPKAIALLEQIIADSPSPRGRYALRAHWMLAGIRLGDWGVNSLAPDVVDPPNARLHILRILTHWADSPEAAFYKRTLNLEDSSKPDYVPLEEQIPFS